MSVNRARGLLAEAIAAQRSGYGTSDADLVAILQELEQEEDAAGLTAQEEDVAGLTVLAHDETGQASEYIFRGDVYRVEMDGKSATIVTRAGIPVAWFRTVVRWTTNDL